MAPRDKSFPIQDDDHYFVVVRYVERNAVRANLVDRAEDWKWGSLFRWLSEPEPEPRLLAVTLAHGETSPLGQSG